MITGAQSGATASAAITGATAVNSTAAKDSIRDEVPETVVSTLKPQCTTILYPRKSVLGHISFTSKHAENIPSPREK